MPARSELDQRNNQPLNPNKYHPCIETIVHAVNHAFANRTQGDKERMLSYYIWVEKELEIKEMIQLLRIPQTRFTTYITTALDEEGIEDVPNIIQQQINQIIFRRKQPPKRF